MATTNAQIWNPAAVNQETDAEYAADPQRAGGAVNDSPFPSMTANKVLNQVSTYIYAFMAALALKGYTTSDADVAVLTAVLGNILTTADQLPFIQTLGYSPTPVFNAGAASGFQMPLNGNVTSSTLSGVVAGQMVAFYFVQDATGGRTVVWPAGMTGTAQPDPTPNAISLQIFRASADGTLRAVGPLVSSTGLVVMNSFTLAAPGTDGQVLTNVGGVFLPRNSVSARVDNANGSYIIMPDGTYLMWGSVPATGSGGHNDWTTAVVFPIAFPNAVQTIQTTLGGLAPTGGKNKSVGVIRGTTSLAGFSAGLAAMVYIDGSGTNLDGGEVVEWFATGY